MISCSLPCLSLNEIEKTCSPFLYDKQPSALPSIASGRYILDDLEVQVVALCGECDDGHDADAMRSDAIRVAWMADTEIPMPAI